MPTTSSNYISTRGSTQILDFEGATLAGLAEDGGLYLPQKWPQFTASELVELRGLSYSELAMRILSPFIGGCIPADILATMLTDAYRSFPQPQVTPLKQIDDSLYLLELFHGPTFAFKDLALQFLGRLFGFFLARRGQTITIIGATSGDTGSAAIEAVRGIDAITLYMLHPKGRVSPVQQRQMTTILDANIHNLAVDGDFDDCQNLVKALFNDTQFRLRYSLAAVNSINWARIATQTIYYFHAALQLGAPEKSVNFAVPSGNFGNVFAGYVARQMGLPINRLIVGSNCNDILTRFFNSGRMARRTIRPTISPSMDIQISSNFERYLFELHDHDSAELTALMAQFETHGEFCVSPEIYRKTRELFSAYSLSDDDTRAAIARVYKQSGELIDPHSAIGVAAARECSEPDTPTVALATAHPAKFSDAVSAACEIPVSLPPSLQELMQREERVMYVENNLAAVKSIIERG